MLGVAQAALFGAAFAQPALLSLWAFDETSDAGGVFADLGPANLAMDIAGTWADLSTGSLVQGIGGTSAYTGGSGYATTPANHPAHNLPALTISLYYQPNGAAVKHTLVAAGNGTQSGDFSIERLTNGRLRGYHVGQDGVLRFFESTSGITGTDLQVGTAYRIDLTLGPSGARIYLDGAPLNDAFILANTNGWNNTRVKYLGIWSDGVSSPADGAFDRFRIWDRQLTSEQIAALEEAISITIPTEAAIMVPRTDLWLANDDMAIPGTGTVRYAEPGGSGVGGTSEGAAGDLQQTLSASSAGDTVVCLQGYYPVPNGLNFPSGSSAANPVTVMAKPGEWAVIARNEQLADVVHLQETAQNPWTLHDAGLNIWKRTVTGLGPGMVDGCFFLYGIPFMLFPYDSLTDLSRAVDSVSKPDRKSGFWFWSGTYYDSGASTLYIRFDRPNWTDVGFVHGTYGAWPDDNRYHLPIQGNSTSDNPSWFSRSVPGDFKTGRPTIGQGLNPNNTRIYLTKHETNQVINTGSGNFIRVGSGINSMGFAELIRSQSQLEVHRGAHWCWAACVNGVSGGSDVTLHRVRCFTGTHRLLGSMAVMKFNSFLTAPILEPTHRTGCFLIGDGFPDLNNWTFENCTFSGYHEFLVGAGTNLDRWRLVNCSIAFTYDEFSQCDHFRFTRFEIGYCYSVNGCPILFSSNEHVSGGAQSNMGSIWVHHNISDDRTGRACFSGGRPIAGSSGNISRFSNEQTSWKYYNNTLVSGVDPAAGIGSFVSPYGGSDVVLTGPASLAQYSEVFNSLMLAHDNKRYQQDEGGRTGFKIDSCETYALTGKNGVSNKELRDYNCYWRNTPVDPATGNRSREKFYWVNQTGGPSFAYIRSNIGGESPGSAVFFGSAAHDLTESVQSGGWDGNSTDADPGVPSIGNDFPASRMDYRPDNAAVVSAVGTPPSGANWWSSPGWTSYGATPVPFNMAPSAWKGALAPNGTTMTVGVQNP